MVVAQPKSHQCAVSSSLVPPHVQPSRTQGKRTWLLQVVTQTSKDSGRGPSQGLCLPRKGHHWSKSVSSQEQGHRNRRQGLQLAGPLPRTLGK